MHFAEQGREARARELLTLAEHEEALRKILTGRCGNLPLEQLLIKQQQQQLEAE